MEHGNTFYDHDSGKAAEAEHAAHAALCHPQLGKWLAHTLGLTTREKLGKLPEDYRPTARAQRAQRDWKLEPPSFEERAAAADEAARHCEMAISRLKVAQRREEDAGEEADLDRLADLARRIAIMHTCLYKVAMLYKPVSEVSRLHAAAMNAVVVAKLATDACLQKLLARARSRRASTARPYRS